MPAIQESWTCCEHFADIYEKRTGRKYYKADENLYYQLIENGDEEKALNIAQRKLDQCIKNGYFLPSHMCPCTTVHLLVKEIRNKTKEKEV